MEAAQCQLFMQTTKSTTPDVARSWALADSVAARAPDSEKEFRRLYGNMLVANVLARAGQKDSARKVIEQSMGNAEIDPTRDLTLLGAYAFVQLDDKQQAVNMLKIYLPANERRRAVVRDRSGLAAPQSLRIPGVQAADERFVSHLTASGLTPSSPEGACAIC